MRLSLARKTTLALIGLVFIAISSVVSAETPKPVVPKGKGEQCVEPTEDMRKNHMKYLKHQRDLTVHEGIRTKKFSLVECIECHVVPNEKGEYPKFGSDDHFCSSCHNYASVDIDCFQCHATKPDTSQGYRHNLDAKAAHHFTTTSEEQVLNQSDIELVTAEKEQQ